MSRVVDHTFKPAAPNVTVTVTASQQDETSELGNVINRAVEFLNDCGDRDLTTCVKERTVKFLDTVTGNLEITEGVTLKEIEQNDESKSDYPEIQTLSENARSSESSIDNLLINRVAKFLGSRTLKFKIPNNTVEEMKRSLDSEEGRKKKKKILLPLLLLLKLKAAVLLPLVLGAIAIISFKALLIGKVALIISVLIAMKKLLESKHASQTYELWLYAKISGNNEKLEPNSYNPA
ncbi:Osiris 9 [Carabus blaptoides fortunei]